MAVAAGKVGEFDRDHGEGDESEHRWRVVGQPTAEQALGRCPQDGSIGRDRRRVDGRIEGRADRERPHPRLEEGRQRRRTAEQRTDDSVRSLEPERLQVSVPGPRLRSSTYSPSMPEAITSETIARGSGAMVLNLCGAARSTNPKSSRAVT